MALVPADAVWINIPANLENVHGNIEADNNFYREDVDPFAPEAPPQNNLCGRNYTNLMAIALSVGPAVLYTTESYQLTASAIALVALGFYLGNKCPERPRELGRILVIDSQQNTKVIVGVARTALGQVNRRNFTRLASMANFMYQAIKFMIKPNVLFSAIAGTSYYFSRETIRKICTFLSNPLSEIPPELGSRAFIPMALALFATGGLIAYNIPQARRLTHAAFRYAQQILNSRVARPILTGTADAARLALAATKEVGKAGIASVRRGVHIARNNLELSRRAVDQVSLFMGRGVGVVTGITIAAAFLTVATVLLPLILLGAISYHFPRAIGYAFIASIAYLQIVNIFIEENKHQI